jgi:hypothetical protein
MLDAFFIQVVFYLSILELDVIITSNLLNFSIKFIFVLSSRISLAPFEFHHYLEKEHPSETRIIINNNRTILVTTNTNVGDRME